MFRLSFTHKLSRRLLAASGIACASLVATTVLASPAVAAESDPVLITSSPEICDLFTGQASTSWTIISVFDKQLTITVDPSSAGTVSPTSATTALSPLNAHPRSVFSQVLGGGVGSFKISFHITGDGIDIDRAVDVTNTCHAIDNPISVKGVVRCNPSGGGATVSWAVTNNGEAEAIVNDVTATPAGATVDADQFTIAANETKSLTETTAVDSTAVSRS